MAGVLADTVAFDAVAGLSHGGSLPRSRSWLERRCGTSSRPWPCHQPEAATTTKARRGWGCRARPGCIPWLRGGLQEIDGHALVVADWQSVVHLDGHRLTKGRAQLDADVMGHLRRSAKASRWSLPRCGRCARHGPILDAHADAQRAAAIDGRDRSGGQQAAFDIDIHRASRSGADSGLRSSASR